MYESLLSCLFQPLLRKISIYLYACSDRMKSLRGSRSNAWNAAIFYRFVIILVAYGLKMIIECMNMLQVEVICRFNFSTSRQYYFKLKYFTTIEMKKSIVTLNTFTLFAISSQNDCDMSYITLAAKFTGPSTPDSCTRIYNNHSPCCRHLDNCNLTLKIRHLVDQYRQNL